MNRHLYALCLIAAACIPRGGVITVSSVEGKGTTFQVNLPAV